MIAPASYTPYDLIPVSIPGAAYRFLTGKYPLPAVLAEDDNAPDRATANAIATWRAQVHLSEAGFGGGRYRAPASIEDATRIAAWLLTIADAHPSVDGDPYAAQLRRAVASMLTSMSRWDILGPNGEQLAKSRTKRVAEKALAAHPGARMVPAREAVWEPGPNGTGGRVVYTGNGVVITTVAVSPKPDPPT